MKSIGLFFRPRLLGYGLLCLAGGVPVAFAGDGPWVAGNGNASVYLGVEGQRLERLDVRDGEGGGDIIDVDSGISTFGLKVVGSVGIKDRMEVEMTLPWYYIRANRKDGPVCTSLGLSACQDTQGVGVVSVRAKGTVVDEFYGAPVTFSLGLETRFGQFTSGTRSRITNMGEGTLDFGLTAAVGRRMSMGSKGYWTGYVEGIARYRLSNTRQYTGLDGEALAVPGYELGATAKALFGWNPNVGIGPEIGLYSRPLGLDFGDLNLTDVDRFSALRVFNMRVGVQVLLRVNERVSFSGSIHKVVYARNNPYTTVVSLGISHFGLLDKRKD